MSIARPSAEAATILRRRAGYARYRVRPDGRGRAGSQIPVGEARAIPLRSLPRVTRHRRVGRMSKAASLGQDFGESFSLLPLATA
jgi:hypothetical protein